jgi:pteridine reductase
VVNVLDWRALRPRNGWLVYTAAKAALAAATKTLALQLAPRIQVNAVAPGAILPPDDRPDWHAERATAAIPLKRTGTPQDLIRAINFLLDSPFITGEILHVSGGEELQ